jgi:BTB/POZ domain
MPSRADFNGTSLSANAKSCMMASGSAQEEDGSSKLWWRGHPDETFSDWCIKIIEEDSDVTREYHVHRVILSQGRRRSLYFSQEFKSQSRQTGERVSNIKLGASEANAFEAMLDYMYFCDLEATPVTALPLVYLADFFDCPGLKGEIIAFILDDLAANDSGLFYLEVAHDYQNVQVMEIANKHCAERFDDIGENLLELPVSLVEELLNCPHIVCKEPERAGPSVCAYILRHRNEITPALLAGATRVEILPKIGDLEVAKVLLDLVKNLNCPSEHPHWNGLTSLCVRCYDELDPDWTALDPRDALLQQVASKERNHQLLLARLTSALQRARVQSSGKDGMRSGV